MRKTFVPLVVAVLLLSLAGSAQIEKVDFEALAKIKTEGLERSKALEVYSHLVDVIGARLTNSPAHKRAVEWTVQTLKAWGLSEVHTEPFDFGRGWTMEKVTVEMIEPRYVPIIAYMKGWSPSTAGRLTGAPVWLPGLRPEALKEHAGKLKGAIVLTSPMQEYFIRADRPAASGDLKPPDPPPARPPQMTPELLATLKAEGVGVTIEPSIGEHGTVFVTGRDAGANAVPALVIAAEHYNMILRYLERKVPVTLAVEAKGTYDERTREAQNVIADIPGVDQALKDEIVMAGAHLDSWHTAAGATDNADGVATVMEALRIIKALNLRPRRTIRLALWAGEEQGLLGSRAYVERHLAGDKNRAARDRFSVYFNVDNGYPPISGFYMENIEPARRIMEEWLKMTADLGTIIPAPGHIGATDHLSFLNVGLPGFQAVQEYVNYDVRTHHTNVDTAERVRPEALKQAATVMANILYHAAMREGKFPRPAPPKTETKTQ